MNIKKSLTLSGLSNEWLLYMSDEVRHIQQVVVHFKMKLRKIIYILTFASFWSCNSEKKDIKSNMSLKIHEDENGNKSLIYETKSVDEKYLIADFEFILEIIEIENLISQNQILFYIDATNGNIFISGYDHENEKTYDDSGIFIKLTEFWDDNQNAYDFDDLTFSAIKKALKSEIGKRIKSKYQVYIQDEIDSPKRVE